MIVLVSVIYLINLNIPVAAEENEQDIIFSPNWMLENGYGYGDAGVGSTALGIFEFSNKYLGAMSGSGDSMTVYGNFNDWYIPGQWNILAIRYNGKEFSFWINGEKKRFSSSSTLKGDILYIGGFSNAGTSSAGVNWG